MPSAGQAGQHRENGGTFGSSFSDALSSTRAYFSPFTTAASQSSSGNGANTGQQSEANKILAEVAPHIMRPRILNAAVAAGASVSSSTSSAALVGRRQARLTQGFSITSPGRSLVRIGGAIRQGPITSNDLRILEASDEILLNAGITDLPDATGIAADVSLLRGFQATVPSALEGRSRRRKARAREGPKLGLKAMGEQARGLLTEGDVDDEEASAFQSKEARKARRANAARGKEEPLSADELMKQNEEIMLEKENINVRRVSRVVPWVSWLSVSLLFAQLALFPSDAHQLRDLRGGGQDRSVGEGEAGSQPELAWAERGRAGAQRRV